MLPLLRCDAIEGCWLLAGLKRNDYVSTKESFGTLATLQGRRCLILAGMVLDDAESPFGGRESEDKAEWIRIHQSFPGPETVVVNKYSHHGQTINISWCTDRTVLGVILVSR